MVCKVAALSDSTEVDNGDYRLDQQTKVLTEAGKRGRILEWFKDNHFFYSKSVFPFQTEMDSNMDTRGRELFWIPNKMFVDSI